MLCLHGKPALFARNHKGDGTWFCSEWGKDDCNFKCSHEEGHWRLYKDAVKVFLAKKQERPKCCAVNSADPSCEERNYARIDVVKDPNDVNFGRGFFRCPKKDKPCISDTCISDTCILLKEPCPFFEWIPCLTKEEEAEYQKLKSMELDQFVTHYAFSYDEWGNRINSISFTPKEKHCLEHHL